MIFRANGKFSLPFRLSTYLVVSLCSFYVVKFKNSTRKKTLARSSTIDRVVEISLSAKYQPVLQDWIGWVQETIRAPLQQENTQMPIFINNIILNSLRDDPPFDILRPGAAGS